MRISRLLGANETSAPEDRYPVGERLDLVHPVSDEDQQASGISHFSHQAKDGLAVAKIKGGRHLAEDQGRVGAARPRARQDDELLGGEEAIRRGRVERNVRDVKRLSALAAVSRRLSRATPRVHKPSSPSRILSVTFRSGAISF